MIARYVRRRQGSRGRRISGFVLPEARWGSAVAYPA